MNVEQEQKSEQTTEQVQQIDKRSAVLLAAALRQHLMLQQQMGINLYPKNDKLLQFLRPKRRRPPALASKNKQPVQAPPVRRPQPPSPPEGHEVPRPNAEELLINLQHCSACSLAANKRKQILGRGKSGARLLIVGDYPRLADLGTWIFGKEADDLLWKMMQAIGLGPNDVYLTNVVKCSPAGELEPDAIQEQACQGHLYQEIAQIQPSVILAMGQSAARAILGSDVSVFRLRGRLHATRFTGAAGLPIPVMVSFHPGYLLEQPGMKRAAWQDLQIVQRQLQQAEKGRRTA